MENQDNNQNENKLTSEMQEHKSSSKTNTIIAIVLLVLLALGVVYATTQKKAKEPLADVESSENVVDTKELNLSQEQRDKLEQQVAQYSEEVESLGADASAEDRIAAHVKLANAYNQLGEYRKALETLNQVAEGNQGSARLWSVYALIYKNQGDLAKAAEAIKTAISLDESNARNWVMYLDLPPQLNQDELTAVYAEAVAKTNNDFNVVTRYAQYLETAGDPAGAIAQWQTAIEVDPDNAAEYQAEIDRLQN